MLLLHLRITHPTNWRFAVDEPGGRPTPPTMLSSLFYFIRSASSQTQAAVISAILQCKSAIVS